jgi:SAM-dependent methyltransferase
MEVAKFASYAEYVETQTAVNRRKLDSVWITAADVDAIAGVVRELVPRARAGICHGVRSGWEVRALRDALGIEVIGTDISSTATEFEHVVRWDFHETNPQWEGRFDFVYSNSLDHSYDPDKCLATWRRSLVAGGLCVLHWGRGHSWSHTPADCFCATKNEYAALLARHFRFVREITVPRIDPRTAKPSRTYLLIAMRRPDDR